MRKTQRSTFTMGLTTLVTIGLLAASAISSHSNAVSATLAADATPSLNPDLYHHVAQVTWVVADVDRIADYWQHLGIHDLHRDGVVNLPNLTHQGKPDPASVKQITTQVDALEIRWIQPVKGGQFWQDSLQKHGDGIRVLSYAVRSSQEFDDQIRYFASKGVGVLVENSWQGHTGKGRFAYLDTSAQGGGNTLGLIDDPDTRANAPAPSATNDYPVGKITHFAWVVNDVRKVDTYYTGLGFKPFSAIDHNISLDRIYRGQPGIFEMWLGWDRTGDAPFEWVQQITGPDVYVEYQKAHGEGFHHLGVNVTDMDEAIKLMTTRGAPPTQLAAWKTAKGGKGRAVYLDTDPHGGVTLELIYNPQ